MNAEKNFYKTSLAQPSELTVRILLVEDDVRLRESIATLLAREGYDVTAAEDGNKALQLCVHQSFDLVLSDVIMPHLNGLELLREIQRILPGADGILITAFATVDMAVAAMKMGAVDFITKPFKKSQLLATVRKSLERRALLQENLQLKQRLAASEGPRRLIAISHAMKAVLDVIDQAAPTSSTILITGESGTGKEVIANEIHLRSRRAANPFVKVSCAALPETLLESELFGHEKGAFTGALTTHRGRFELAHKGTLFLDEVGEIPQHLQVKLLRVLQEGQFERVGGTRSLYTDMRLIAATNRDLRKAIQDQMFREDLFYRLNVIPIAIPPLRERTEEIPLLADHFLRRYREKNGKPDLEMTEAFLDSLLRYTWPGNVRELQNVIERAVVLSRGRQIEVAALPDALKFQLGSTTALHFPLGSTLREIEERAIEKMLDHAGGDKERAAKLLGIAPRTVYRFLERKRKFSVTDCHENPGDDATS